MNEEDIKILEELKETLQENIDFMDRENKTFYEGMVILYKKRIQAIENVINRNKELERKKVEIIFKLSNEERQKIKNVLQELEKQCIPVQKVKEKIVEVKSLIEGKTARGSKKSMIELVNYIKAMGKLEVLEELLKMGGKANEKKTNN